jgi:hypothetical protein
MEFLVHLHDIVKACSDIFKKRTSFIFRMTEYGKGTGRAKPVGDVQVERCSLVCLYQSDSGQQDCLQCLQH